MTMMHLHYMLTTAFINMRWAAIPVMVSSKHYIRLYLHLMSWVIFLRFDWLQCDVSDGILNDFEWFANCTV